MIRALEEKDIAIVVAIAKASMPHPWEEKIFRDCLKENYRNWVIENKSEIIGFIVILVEEDAQLMNIAIHPAYQHQGFASQLLRHAIQYLQSHSIKRLLLEVRKSNQSAIHFYQKWGGKQIGIRKDYYPKEKTREDACIFEIVFH